ncbi:MAG: SRPBCC family protein [Desulfobacterales bacterium]|nr:MAG: SRPBCC family protein [Desulfobacterales bacterium]
MKLENSVFIQQPVETVFAFVTDPANNAKWQTDILEIELISEGPLSLGYTYRCVNRFMGQRFDIKVEITGYEPEKRCAYKFNSGNLSGESSYSFEKVNGGTKLTTLGELDLGFFKMANFLFKRKARAQLRNDMSTLKHILENGA